MRFLAQDHNITASTERVCMIVQDNAGGTKPESTKPGSMYHDQLLIDTMGMSAEGRVCFRCKMDTHTVESCIFESNVFYAKKSLPCRACGKFIERGSSQITGLKRGQYAGMYLHALCAKAWYESNPLDASCKMPELEYHQPTEELANWLDKFVDGTDKLYHLSATAGAGKSNNIMYTCDKLRKRDKPFIVLVFSISAKEVLMKRGLMASEVINFHSFLFAALKRWLKASIAERATMLSDASSKSDMDVEPTVVKQKIRLVLSLFLKLTKAEHCGALTKLLRPFVSALCDQARTHGFSTPMGPSNFDTDALHHLVQRYHLESKLTAAWDGQLTQPEKLNLDRSIGAGAETRLDYAVEVTAQVLDLSELVACQPSVQGERYLFNEVQKKYISLPVIDQHDMDFIPIAKELDLGKYSHVIIDEGQDSTINQLQTMQRCTAEGGSVLFLSDESQSSYLWTGVEKDKIAEWLRDANTYTLASNYRCATLICAEAQPFLDQMGRDLVIQPMRDVEGVVATGPFHAHPIRKGEKTLVIGRTTRHVLIFYFVLLSKGYPVNMHGRENTGTSLLGVLSELKVPTLAASSAILDAYLNTHAPANDSNAYDLRSSLSLMIKEFSRVFPHLDLAMPMAMKDFEAWLPTVFNDNGHASVLLATFHAAKGLEGDSVYIINPDMSPLKERLDGQDWERYEELCVAFIARTRAKDRLIYLPDLESTTRGEVEALFVRPVELENAETIEEAPESQEMLSTSSIGTSLTNMAVMVLDKTSDKVTSDTTPLAAALITLGLTEMPDTHNAVDAAVRKILLTVRPDSDLGSTAKKDLQKAVLEARKLVKSAMMA